jgi:hypothetical protein
MYVIGRTLLKQFQMKQEARVWFSFALFTMLCIGWGGVVVT